MIGLKLLLRTWPQRRAPVPVLEHQGMCVQLWSFGPRAIKDDNASQWKSGKFDFRSLKKPLNRSSPKFARVITSGTPTPMQNFITIRLSPFAPQICENAHQVTRLVFLIFPGAYSQDPCTDFHDQYVKWRGFAQGCAFWGSRRQNFTFRPHFPRKTPNCRRFSTGLRKFRVRKALTMEMLPCKLPLIVIVAQWKLYSE